MTELSPPEHVCDRRDRMRIVAQVVQAGGCGACLHRQHVLDRVICSGPAGRSFPLCTVGGMPKFELDESKLRAPR